MYCTSYEGDWCRGNTVDLFLVDACSYLGQVINYPDGDFYNLSESFLEIARTIHPISPTLQNCFRYISHRTV